MPFPLFPWHIYCRRRIIRTMILHVNSSTQVPHSSTEHTSLRKVTSRNLIDRAANVVQATSFTNLRNQFSRQCLRRVQFHGEQSIGQFDCLAVELSTNIDSLGNDQISMYPVSRYVDDQDVSPVVAKMSTRSPCQTWRAHSEARTTAVTVGDLRLRPFLYCDGRGGTCSVTFPAPCSPKRLSRLPVTGFVSAVNTRENSLVSCSRLPRNQLPLSFHHPLMRS